MTTMTFKQFQATGRDVANLRDIEDAAAQLTVDGPKAGRVYLTGGLFVEKEPDGKWLLADLDGVSYVPTTDLESLERLLYDFYCAEYA